MTATELAQYGVTQTHNSASAALLWITLIAATCALVAYVAIRATDKAWKRRIKREAVR